MISKNKAKLISSLSKKKIRDKSGLFVAEGFKIISDLIMHNIEPEFVVASSEMQEKLINAGLTDFETIIEDESSLKKLSNQQSPQNIIAVFKKSSHKPPKVTEHIDISLALDDLQDPGNMGTIIRLAVWFGIKNIYCSKNCADVYNPKTIQAAMGAISFVNIYNVDLEDFLKTLNSIPVYGAFLEGSNIYQSQLSNKGIIVLGNEGNGISKKIEQYVTDKITIPKYSSNNNSIESLNVSTAASIICSEFRRRST